MTARGRLACALASVTVLVSGCGLNLYDVPLPGGADVGAQPYRVKVQFSDVLDLVPQSAVKVDDVAVGRVESVSLGADGWTAEATLLVNDDVVLPANADAALRQSSLLGEKFVELLVPTAAPTGRLADGDTIPLERTQRSVELEEAFGALSLLLNGGGVAQLQTITRELNSALGGREQDIRSLLEQLTTLVTGLDDQRAEISRAIDGLNTLSATVAGQRDQIALALDELPAGLQVLEEQRPEFVALLTGLQDLSVVATDVIEASRDNTVADLQALRPTLEALAAAGDDLPNALEIIGTYPFTDGSVQAVQGSQLNLYLQADLGLGTLLDNLSAPSPSTLVPGAPTAAGPGATPAPAQPSPPLALPPLLGDLGGLLPLPLPGLPAPSADTGGGGLGGLLGGLLGGGS